MVIAIEKTTERNTCQMHALQARQSPTSPLPSHARAYCRTHELFFSALNKKRILDMGGKDMLVILSRSNDDKTKQQASKALANLDSSVLDRK